MLHSERDRSTGIWARQHKGRQVEANKVLFSEVTTVQDYLGEQETTVLGNGNDVMILVLFHRVWCRLAPRGFKGRWKAIRDTSIGG